MSHAILKRSLYENLQLMSADCLGVDSGEPTFPTIGSYFMSRHITVVAVIGRSLHARIRVLQLAAGDTACDDCLTLHVKPHLPKAITARNEQQTMASAQPGPSRPPFGFSIEMFQVCSQSSCPNTANVVCTDCHLVRVSQQNRCPSYAH